MAVNLSADNYALVRAAYTAMDQTYGYTQAGYNLQSIDNSGQGKTQPWQTPPGWKIAQSLDEPVNGGKFVIYKNEATNQVMVVAMGTNGNGDIKGWASNAENVGLSQWLSPARDPVQNLTIKERVLKALNDEMAGGATLVLAGDSKGGAQAQYILHDVVKLRDSTDSNYANLTSLTNDRMALVVRNAPGGENAIKSYDASFDPADSKYFVSSHISATQIVTAGGFVLRDAVSQIGGRYIGSNSGSILYLSKTEDVSSVLTGISGENSIAYIHRLTSLAYDALAEANGDFGSMAPSVRTTVSADLQKVLAD